MRAISTLLWQLAVVLAFLTVGMTTAATLAAGMFIGIWFCIISLAVSMGRAENEQRR